MKKKKIKNRVSALLLSGVIVSGLIAPAFSFSAKAEALEVLNSSCTVADMVFSYCASSGMAILNDTVINEVYQELGTSFGTLQSFYNNGLLTYADGQFIDTGLSVNIESALNDISSIDIGALFNQTAEQNASGVAMTGAASLGGIAASVASTGVLPLVAGVAIEGWAGFQLGTLIANELGLYDKNIVSGTKINTPDDVLNRIPSGMACCSYHYSDGDAGIICGPITILYNFRGFDYLGIYNPSDSSITVKRIEIDNGDTITGEDYFACSAKDTFTVGIAENRCTYVGVSNKFSNRDDFLSALNSWRSGSSTPKSSYSPDLIGTSGNLQGAYDANNNQYTVPDVLPQIDPSTQSVNPSGLSLDDWLRFANDAKGNYSDGNPEINNDIFDDILDAIRQMIPTPSPDPTPTPDPGGETYPVPGPVPDPSDVPDPDYQPETKPQPDFTEKQTENQTDITEGDPWTTPDLLDKFPFCIPRDVYRVFTKLDSGARSAPHIQWRFHPNDMIDYTFDIDFSTWDNIATLLRALELLAFIVALAVATRKMIMS